MQSGRSKMSDYGECLKKYIKENGISVRRLSIETEINRTLLQKYLSGDRLPKSIREVEHISECLMLSPEKQEKLTEEYNKSCYGSKRYESFLMIRDVLNGLVDFRLDLPPQTERGSFPAQPGVEQNAPIPGGQACKTCLGAMEVENVLRNILEEQKNSGQNKRLEILSQPDAGNLMPIVLSACVGQETEVEQIVCLDEDSAEGNNNIRVIYSLLPMLFGNINHQSYYYYDKKEAHINTMSLLPVLILAGDYGMVCNSKMDEGLVFWSKESVEFYRRQYQKIKRRTSFLTGYLNDITEWMTFIRSFVTELSTAEICIGATPCLTACLDEAMLFKYLRMDEKDNQFVMEALAENRSKLTGKGAKRMVNIFSEEGLRHFLETGRSNEYPDSCYTPIDMADRLLILERVIEIAEKGIIIYNMTNPLFLNLDRRLLIYINEKIVFQYHQKNAMSQYFRINERTVRRGFRDFVEFSRENRWLCGAEETIARMKEILSEYRQKSRK